MRIYVATHNKHKLSEMAAILGPGAELEPDDPGVEENAPDFRGNALLKARATASRHPGEWVMADDSGLEVDALGGEPGVRSARYAGEPESAARNNEKLLARLAGRKDRRARFRCCIAVISPGGAERFAEGACEGTIIESPAGAEGFGYDPLFLPEGGDRTFAELSAGEKNAVSHRARALAAARAVLGIPARAPEPA